MDLVVYCKSGHAAAVLSALTSIANIAPVVHRFSGKHDNESVFEKTILEDGSSHEIHVIEPTTRMRLRSPYIELLNRQDYLAVFRVSEDKPIGRGTIRPFSSGEAGLVWELFNCMKWLRRGDVVTARSYIQELGIALAKDGTTRVA